MPQAFVVQIIGEGEGEIFPILIIDVTELVVDNADYIDDGTNNGTNGSHNISREDSIIELMRHNKRISVKDISGNLGIPRRTLFRIIDKLKTDNRIKRVGDLKSGTWEVLD